MRRRIAHVCLLVGCLGFAPLAIGQDAPAAADARLDPRFAHLALKPGGPAWSISSLAALLPPGKPPMMVDPTKSIPPITDAEGALKAGVELLAAKDRVRHEAAYRVTGATVNATKHPLAVKLFALLQFHGIGTRADAKLAVRTTLPLVKAGDVEACEFVAAADPETFADNVARATSIRKLLANKTAGAFRVEAPIASSNGDDVTLRGDADLPVRLADDVIGGADRDRIEKGRVMQVAGLFDAGGTLRALVAAVPEPVVNFDWKLDRESDQGRYRLSKVRVTVRNKGVQHVRDLSFKVRCWSRTDDHTRTAEVGDLAPGKSRTVEVNFGMYDWYWGINAGDPKAEVSVEHVEW